MQATARLQDNTLNFLHNLKGGAALQKHVIFENEGKLRVALFLVKCPDFLVKTAAYFSL